MKKLVLTLLAGCMAATMITAVNAKVTRINNYKDLSVALKNGHRVNVVAEDAKCKVTDSSLATKLNDPDLSATLGMSLTNSFFLEYQWDNDPRRFIGAIATNSIAAEDGTHIRYKLVRVFDDNTVEVKYSNSEATGKELGSITFGCGISNGHDKNGVSLFDYDA